MVQVSHEVPEGRLLIEGYGGGHFEVSGTRYEGSILVLQGRVEAWPVAAAGEITAESLQPLLAAARELEVLLIGCGPKTLLLPPPLRQALREHGLGVDAMATAAACRTFNVLMMEGRAAAAALIAVD